MLPLDLTADPLLFHHQKYQEPQNLLHMCIYSSLARNAAKQDRMRPNAHNSGLPQGSSSYTKRAVVTPLIFPQVPQSIPARETCWGLLNKPCCLKQLEAGKHAREVPRALALFFLFPGHLFVVIVGHNTVGKTDLGLNWNGHSEVHTCGKKRKIFHNPSSSCQKTVIAWQCIPQQFFDFFSPWWSPITKQPSQCYAQQSLCTHLGVQNTGQTLWSEKLGLKLLCYQR